MRLANIRFGLPTFPLTRSWLRGVKLVISNTHEGLRSLRSSHKGNCRLDDPFETALRIMK